MNVKIGYSLSNRDQFIKFGTFSKATYVVRIRILLASIDLSCPCFSNYFIDNTAGFHQQYI